MHAAKITATLTSLLLSLKAKNAITFLTPFFLSSREESAKVENNRG